jgi:hypothetical protein
MLTCAAADALAAANATREALELHNTQLASQRDQLLGIIDDLSMQLEAGKASGGGASSQPGSSSKPPKVSTTQGKLQLTSACLVRRHNNHGRWSFVVRTF